MASDSVPFASLLKNIVDNRGKTCPIADSGIPLIATNCVKNEFLYPSYESVRFVDEHTYATWFRGHPLPGDFLFVTKGSPGRVAVVPDPVDFCIAQDMVAIRADPNKIYPLYLFALLRSREVQERIGQLHVGTMIPHFKKGDFDKLLLPVPDRRIQEFIGNCYFVFSSKIDLNRKMNETLEAMARAFFKSWFVDFDPVRAKAEGRDTGLPARIAALFPDSFEDSEIGEIPFGWSLGEFGDVAENQRRGVSPGEIPPQTPYIALEHMPRKSIALSEWGTADNVGSGKFTFKANEILFGKLRPYFHKVGVAPVDGVCSTDILVVTPRSPEWFGFVLGHVSSCAFIEYANAGSTGTKMPRTNWSDLARYPVVLPPTSIAMVFAEMARKAVSRIVASIHENRTSAALRDSLLPKLISGGIRLSQKEERT